MPLRKLHLIFTTRFKIYDQVSQQPQIFFNLQKSASVPELVKFLYVIKISLLDISIIIRLLYRTIFRQDKKMSNCL